MYNLLVALYVLLTSFVLASAGYAQGRHDPMLLVLAVLCGAGAICVTMNVGPLLVARLRGASGSVANKRAIYVSLSSYCASMLIVLFNIFEGKLFLNGSASEVPLYISAALVVVSIAIPLFCGFIEDLRDSRG